MMTRRHLIHGKLIERQGSVFIFQCPAGHKSRRDYSKGPKHKRMSPALFSRFERYWKDGISYECRACRRAVTQ